MFELQYCVENFLPLQFCSYDRIFYSRILSPPSQSCIRQMFQFVRHSTHAAVGYIARPTSYSRVSTRRSKASKQLIQCSFTKKASALGDFVPETPYRGSAPGPRWGPQTSSLLLCPPNNPVRSTPLFIATYCT